jgi:hypothetical protein
MVDASADHSALPIVVTFSPRRCFVAEFEEERQPSSITVAYAGHGYRQALGDKPAAVTIGHEWKAVAPFFGEMAADALTEGDCKSYAALRRGNGRSDGTIWTELLPT